MDRRRLAWAQRSCGEPDLNAQRGSGSAWPGLGVAVARHGLHSAADATALITLRLLAAFTRLQRWRRGRACVETLELGGLLGVRGRRRLGEVQRGRVAGVNIGHL